MNNHSNNHSNNTNNRTRNFSLSKIHRLIRPLRSSIQSLNQSSSDLLQKSNNSLSHQSRSELSRFRKLYNRSKPSTNRRISGSSSGSSRQPLVKDQDEFLPYWITNNRPVRLTLSRSKTSRLNRRSDSTNQQQISSPVFTPSDHHRHHQLITQPSPPATHSSSASLPSSSPLKSSYHPSSDPSIRFNDLHFDLRSKRQRLLLAYKNILDSICYLDDDRTTSRDDSNRILNFVRSDRLTMVCARVIGNRIEEAIQSDLYQLSIPPVTNSDNHHHQVKDLTSLTAENDHRTTIMDEWYDAIPTFYRRFTLAQHALSLILSNYSHRINNPNNNNNLASSCLSNSTSASPDDPFSSNYHQLLKSIHSLHKTYNSPLIRPQASLLLPYLFDLHSLNWFEFYRDYSTTFDLRVLYRNRFMAHMAEHRSDFLRDWCNWSLGLIDLIDLTVDQFSSFSFQVWIDQREALIESKLLNKQRRKETRSGLRSPSPSSLTTTTTTTTSSSSSSSDSDDDDQEIVSDYDRRTSAVLLRWIDSLVLNCLPNSNTSLDSRAQLNSISKILYDSYNHHSSRRLSKSQNSFLIILLILVESHRLTIFGLRLFQNLSTPTIVHNDPQPAISNSSSSVTSLDPNHRKVHQPLRLRVILSLLDPNVDQLDRTILKRSSKHFLRTHRHTRLLAILPGGFYLPTSSKSNSSSSNDDDNHDNLRRGRKTIILPGLDQLMSFMIDNESTDLIKLAKSFVQVLLQTDPASWWTRERDRSLTGSSVNLNRDPQKNTPYYHDQQQRIGGGAGGGGGGGGGGGSDDDDELDVCGGMVDGRSDDGGNGGNCSRDVRRWLERYLNLFEELEHRNNHLNTDNEDDFEKDGEGEGSFKDDDDDSFILTVSTRTTSLNNNFTNNGDSIVKDEEKDVKPDERLTCTCSIERLQREGVVEPDEKVGDSVIDQIVPRGSLPTFNRPSTSSNNILLTPRAGNIAATTTDSSAILLKSNTAGSYSSDHDDQIDLLGCSRKSLCLTIGNGKRPESIHVPEDLYNGTNGEQDAETGYNKTDGEELVEERRREKVKRKKVMREVRVLIDNSSLTTHLTPPEQGQEGWQDDTRRVGQADDGEAEGRSSGRNGVTENGCVDEEAKVKKRGCRKRRKRRSITPLSKRRRMSLRNGGGKTVRVNSSRDVEEEHDDLDLINH